MLWALTLGPLALTFIAWCILGLTWRKSPPHRFSVGALAMATANALWAVYWVVQAKLEPSTVPPWQGANLNEGLLFLSAPVGMLAGLALVHYDGPRWLVLLIEVALFPLALFGFACAVSV